VFKEGSDRKRKRVSDKIKKSWRKHTDTKNVDFFCMKKELKNALVIVVSYYVGLFFLLVRHWI
jgi:hypothetical protein